MTGDRALSEDLVQEVFLRMLRYRDTFHSGSQFRGWMYQIARNVRMDHFRSNLRQDAVLSESEPAPATAPSHLEMKEQTALLERALRALAEDKREILVLARYQEMTYAEIAALLNIEVGAVKVRVHRALKELREIFLKMSGEKPTWNAKKFGITLRIN
jgi:RNA polymerase sigma-70 factor (ECF subfamily)